ncbi:MAG: OsmC family protein, partial [Thermoplasmata archaeon]|nr:OsmC family protein [Thermoplasmata archaeon]
CHMSTGGGASMDFSSPPEYKGHEGVMTPEELFVASENTCLLMTFIAIAEKMRFEFLSYECDGVGHLERTDEGPVFTRIILRPRIEIRNEEDFEKVERALELADKNCFIANSMKTEVTIEPEIVVTG